jgi:hypothetical protein
MYLILKKAINPFNRSVAVIGGRGRDFKSSKRALLQYQPQMKNSMIDRQMIGIIWIPPTPDDAVLYKICAPSG